MIKIKAISIKKSNINNKNSIDFLNNKFKKIKTKKNRVL